MKVLLSAASRDYLRRETAYLRDLNPASAKSFSARLRAAFRHLAVFKKIGMEGEGLPIPGMRRLIAGDYLLDYEIVRQEIWIASIRHARQMPIGAMVEEDFDYEDDGA